MSREQQIWVVNHLKIGTQFDIFRTDSDNQGWYTATVISVELIENCIYHTLKLRNQKNPLRLHLQHYRLRNFSNLLINPIDRSSMFLNKIGLPGNVEKIKLTEKNQTIIPMDIDENKSHSQVMSNKSWKKQKLRFHKTKTIAT